METAQEPRCMPFARKRTLKNMKALPVVAMVSRLVPQGGFPVFWEGSVSEALQAQGARMLRKKRPVDFDVHKATPT